MKILTIVLLLFPVLSFAQEDAGADPWEPLRYFVGEWTGHETGVAGIGKGTRKYEFVLQDTYLHYKNRSEFEPQEKNPEGEIHEDWGIISYDKIRGVFVLRQFNVETFVNQFVLEQKSVEGRTLFVFLSESVENLPQGFRVRYSIEVINENEFEEVFELAPPGKDFTQLLKNYWTRKTDG